MALITLNYYLTDMDGKVKPGSLTKAWMVESSILRSGQAGKRKLKGSGSPGTMIDGTVVQVSGGGAGGFFVKETIAEIIVLSKAP